MRSPRTAWEWIGSGLSKSYCIPFRELQWVDKLKDEMSFDTLTVNDVDVVFIDSHYGYIKSSMIVILIKTWCNKHWKAHKDVKTSFGNCIVLLVTAVLCTYEALHVMSFPPNLSIMYDMDLTKSCTVAYCSYSVRYERAGEIDLKSAWEYLQKKLL